MSAAMVVPLVVGAAAAFRFYHLHGFAAYVLVQCVLGGTGGTLATTTIWGYLEDFAHAPHLDLVYVYPIFWLFVLVSYPVVRLRYR
jgi:hypothetical protein